MTIFGKMQASKANMAKQWKMQNSKYTMKTSLQPEIFFSYPNVSSISAMYLGKGHEWPLHSHGACIFFKSYARFKDGVRLRGDAIEVYKYMKGFLDVEKENLFKPSNQPQPKTRHQHSFMPLVVPRARLDLRKNFFSVRGAKIWNNLPSAVRASNTVNKFKNSYDSYMQCT